MNPVVLEGCDCAGKTTLARELEKCGYTYVHNGPPAPGEYVLKTYTEQLFQSANSLVVFDRFHLGEVIYGPILRGHSGLSDEDYISLDIRIQALGGIVVICLPTWQQVLDGWAGRKDKEHVQQYAQMREVYNQYRRLIETHDHYLHYDYNLFTAASYAMALQDLRRP